MKYTQKISLREKREPPVAVRQPLSFSISITTTPGRPLLSIGPSGLGGEFQKEYNENDVSRINLGVLVLSGALLMGGK